MADDDSPPDREATIYRIDRPDHREWVSKPALAALYKKSTRWVELRMRDGMPSILDEKGERRYKVKEIEAWLARRPKPQLPVDRVGRLDAEVTELRREVGELRRLVDELTR
jgi:hypothetical protein